MSQYGVLLALRGGCEERFLQGINAERQLEVSRRCADAAEVLAAAIAGVGEIAVIDPQLGVTRSLLHRLKQAGTIPVVVCPHSERDIYEAMGARVIDVDVDEPIPVLLTFLGDTPALEEAQLDQPQAEGLSSSVIAITSPWGSPGRTTIAVNLASAFAARGGNPLVVDGDIWGASVKQYLGLDPDGLGIAAAIRSVERGTFDLESLTQLCEQHERMHVLGGLNKSDRWREVSSPAVSDLWSVIKTWPGQVVVDAPVRLPTSDGGQVGGFGPDPNTMWETITQAANRICLIGGADTVGVHRFINFLLDEYVNEPQVVINRVRASAGGPRAHQSLTELLTRFAGVNNAILIPEDEAVDEATLKAGVLRTVAPKAAATEAIELLADTFLPTRSRGKRLSIRQRLRRHSAH